MGCANGPNDRDAKMLGESGKGTNCNLDPKILEECKPITAKARKEAEELQKSIENVIPPSAASILDRPGIEVRILPSQPPSEIENLKTSIVVEKVCKMNPRDMILFREKNGSLRSVITVNTENHPKNIPKVAETSIISKRIAPTIENILRMRKGNAPLDENGKELNLHHHQQKKEGPLYPMDWQTHRGKEGLKDFLHGYPPLQERQEFEEHQKPAYYKWVADRYLGEYWVDIFNELEIKNNKIVHKS